MTATPPSNTTDSASEFQIAEMVAEQLDQLPKDKQRQVMALLATRYGLTIKDPPAATGRGYRPSPKRRY
jgi:hypothetical protein